MKHDLVIPMWFGSLGVVLIILLIFKPPTNEKIVEIIGATATGLVTVAIAVAVPTIKNGRL